VTGPQPAPQPPAKPGRLATGRWIAAGLGLVGVLGSSLSWVLNELISNAAANWLGFGGSALVGVAGWVAKRLYKHFRAPAEPATEPPNTPLPEFTAPLGRDALIDQVVELARERGNVLIHGPAGMGTSTVAAQAARRLVPDADADRRTYVDLRGQRPGHAESPSRVRIRVLAALGLPPAAARDAAGAAAEVAGKLAADRRLLLLDNVASADQIGWLSAPVPGAHVLAAGTQPAPDLPGFAAVAVGALDPAVAARVLYAAYRRPPDRIEAEVSGLPAEDRKTLDWYLSNPSVAILIGTWLASGPAVSIADLLEQLSGGRAGGTPSDEDAESAVRKQLHARLNQGLSPRSRRLLELLAAAPVSELSVTTMATYVGWRRRRVKAALEELEPRSLLQQVRPGRYRIPDPVRAAEASAAGPRGGEARLVRHYARTAGRDVRALTGAVTADQRVRARSWFRLEDTALLGLLQRDEPHGRSADLWTIADALDVWFEWEDRLDDRRDAAAAMAAVARARGATVAEETALLRLVAVDELLDRDPEDHMRAVRELHGRSRSGPRHARLHEHEGRRLMATADVEAAANEFVSARRHRPGRDAVGRVIDLANLGAARLAQGRAAEARQCAEEALDLAQRVADVAGQAHALELLGLVDARYESYKLAREDLGRARPLYAEVHDTLGQARCLTHLGTLRLIDPHRTGVDLAEAAKELEESLVLRNGRGGRYGIALTYLRLAEVADARGDCAAADRHRMAGLAALGDPAPGTAEPPPMAELRRRVEAAGSRVATAAGGLEIQSPIR
jgi:tetratricopeptide (TPR) repeat protein